MLSSLCVVDRSQQFVPKNLGDRFPYLVTERSDTMAARQARGEKYAVSLARRTWAYPHASLNPTPKRVFVLAVFCCRCIAERRTTWFS